MKEFWRYVQMLTGDIKIHKPDVIVASSFGGVLTRVILEGGWTGPTVFLAQAAEKFKVTTTFPAGHRAIFIHGRQDEVVGIEGSEMLANSSADATLIEAVNDGHRLKADKSREAYLAAITELLQD